MCFCFFFWTIDPFPPQDHFQQSYCVFTPPDPSLCLLTGLGSSEGWLVGWAAAADSFHCFYSNTLRGGISRAEYNFSSWVCSGKPGSLINRNHSNASIRQIYFFPQIRILFIPFQKLITTHVQNKPEQQQQQRNKITNQYH